MHTKLVSSLPLNSYFKIKLMPFRVHAYGTYHDFDS